MIYDYRYIILSECPAVALMLSRDVLRADVYHDVPLQPAQNVCATVVFLSEWI